MSKPQLTDHIGNGDKNPNDAAINQKQTSAVLLAAAVA